MNIPTRSPVIAASLMRQKARLSMPLTTNLGVLLLPIGLMSLLLIYVSVETNPRIFSTAKPLQLNLPAEEDNAKLWFSLAPSEQGIVIVSNSGESFDLVAKDGETDLTAFTEHLKARVMAVISDVAIANRMDAKSSFVVLSVDERLTYSHVRPVIYALAEAGITRYGFEGRVLKN